MGKQAILTLMGTGGSMGVPVIGCRCPVCTSSDRRNKRLRSGALLQIEQARYVIDVGPDFREQALRHHVDDITGVLLTHAHYDHVGGLDDLRTYTIVHQKPVPVLLSEHTMQEVKLRYRYLFEKRAQGSNMTADLDCTILESDSGRLNYRGLDIAYFTYHQGGMPVTGYRFGPLGYVSDICDYDESIYEALDGVEILIVSALRETPSNVHFTVQDAIAFARRVGSQKTYFVHMAHEIDYDETSQKLPAGIELAYDGQEIGFVIDE